MVNFNIDLEKIALFKDDIYLGFFLFIAIFVEYYFRKTKKVLKKQLNLKYDEISRNQENENGYYVEDEFYLEYYKKIQLIDLIRIFIVILVIFGIILFKNPSSVFNFLAIALGALLVSFKEVILSFLCFFFIVGNYKIGDIIVFGDSRGEIIYIKPLFVGAVGRDENGENTGQLYFFPNMKFITDIVKKEEIKINNSKKETVIITYSEKYFSINFVEFKNKLTSFLDSKLNILSSDDVGNYKTYIGFKYKIRYDYDKENIVIKIGFIDKPIIAIEKKEDIITFIESLKKIN